MNHAYPLTWPTGWPRCTTRVRAKFGTGEYTNGASYVSYRAITNNEAYRRVMIEVSRLKVQRPLISTNLKLKHDGLPLSDQPEPADPGAAVYWERGGVSQVMAIDRYTRIADNLAAIAATLEAMRAIARHGGAVVLDRAFTGFAALPAPKTCWDILGISPTDNEETIMSRFRWLVKLHHPDTGGDAARMREIIEARDAAMQRIGAQP